MIKRILVNIALICLLFCIIESYCFYKTKSENEMFKQKADRLETNNTRSYKTKYVILKSFNPIIWRNSFVNETSEKKPVLWFGCSFAEGAGLEDNQTPCYKISKLTKRNCINKAKGATGTQFMYYQIKNDKLIEEVPSADFVIYTFIWNHLQRLYNYQVNPLIDMFNLRYKIKNGELKEVKPLFKPFYSSFFVKKILNKKVYNQYKKECIDFELFNKIMEKSANRIKNLYPDSKFILLEFPDLSRNQLPDYEIKKLESYGITVVKVTDLTKDIDIYNNKYWLPDNIHPSEEAWDIILPELTKKYLN